MPSFKVWELTPTNHRKSFYRKAVVIQDANSGYTYLQSYSTIVCAVNSKGEFKKYWNDYSATTMNHINSFCDTMGVKGYSKKEYLALPVSDFSGEYQKIRQNNNYKIAGCYAWI